MKSDCSINLRNRCNLDFFGEVFLIISFESKAGVVDGALHPFLRKDHPININTAI